MQLTLGKMTINYESQRDNKKIEGYPLGPLNRSEVPLSFVGKEEFRLLCVA